MKKIIFSTILAISIVMGGCGNRSIIEDSKDSITSLDSSSMNNVAKEDLAGISKALDLYVKAAVDGDSKVARPAFIDGATMTFVENDSIVCLPIQALFDYYDQTGKQPASYEISECNVANNVAMVRIESVFGESKFSDIFTLAKEGKDWKIVSKIYTVK